MNTNYKFTNEQQVTQRPNNFAQPCPLTNYPRQFPYTPFASPAPMILQQPMTPPVYPYPLLASQMYMTPQQPTYPYPMAPQMNTPYQQPINSSINNKYITNENEEFIVDPTNTKFNGYEYDLTDKHICSIDFNDVQLSYNTSSRYGCYGTLVIVVYINKDGSIDAVLIDKDACCDDDDFYYDDDRDYEEPNYPDPELYKRTFTAEEVKSVGDHCMEKLLCAFMSEAVDHFKEENK